MSFHSRHPGYRFVQSVRSTPEKCVLRAKKHSLVMRAARAEMMSGSDCAEVLPVKSGIGFVTTALFPQTIGTTSHMHSEARDGDAWLRCEPLLSLGRSYPPDESELTPAE